MAIDRLVRFFALVAGSVLFGLMLLTVYSVVMRYAFNAPPIFTLDLSNMMLIPAVAFGIAYCGWTGGHIAVDLIGALGRPGLVRWTDAAVRLVCAAVIGLWAWKLAELAIDSREIGDATNMVQIPHYPFIWTMAAGAALYALVLVALAVRAYRGMEDPPSS